MRRFDLSQIATIPTALALALAAVALVTALTHMVNQLHGFIDGTAIVGAVWAMRRYDKRNPPAAAEPADLEGLADRLVHRTTIATIAELHGDRCTLSQPPAEHLRAI